MTGLSPKANALLLAGRSLYRPSLSDLERVAAALRMRLGFRALPSDVRLAFEGVAALQNSSVAASDFRQAPRATSVRKRSYASRRRR